MLPNVGRYVPLFSLAAISLSLAGCADQVVTKENYDKIKIGMTQKEVEAILGPPNAKIRGSGMRGFKIVGDYGVDDNGNLIMRSGLIEWMGNARTITLEFQNGRVTSKKQSGLE
jgi:hypothetical protein